jgi:hypothetical protein
MKIISLFALCVALTACGPAGGTVTDTGQASGDTGASTPDGGPAGTPTICDLQESNVFAACTGCHSARSRKGDLVIDKSSPQALYDSLTQNVGASGNPLVVGGDSATSWLWVRMAELQGEDAMPPAGILFSNQRNPIRDWIDGNALDDCL